jgi:hypothetical protein
VRRLNKMRFRAAALERRFDTWKERYEVEPAVMRRRFLEGG